MSRETPKAVQIPKLIHRSPACPLCGAGTSLDGERFDCSSCGVRWPDPHDLGERIDENQPMCGAECQPFSAMDDAHRCVLPAGHSRVHRGVTVGSASSDTCTWSTR